jgi:hypothetical protein
MNNSDGKKFFECLGEIWRDITMIEFLMRCAIAKNNLDINLLPKPPYIKGKIYKKYPKSFYNSKFENLVKDFNKIFSDIQIPKEFIELRHAMAHGIIAKIDEGKVDELIKFKEINKQLHVEFKLTLEQEKIEQLRQSLSELRRFVAEKATD